MDKVSIDKEIEDFAKAYLSTSLTFILICIFTMFNIAFLIKPLLNLDILDAIEMIYAIYIAAVLGLSAIAIIFSLDVALYLENKKPKNE